MQTATSHLFSNLCYWSISVITVFCFSRIHPPSSQIILFKKLLTLTASYWRMGINPVEWSLSWENIPQITTLGSVSPPKSPPTGHESHLGLLSCYCFRLFQTISDYWNIIYWVGITPPSEPDSQDKPLSALLGGLQGMPHYTGVQTSGMVILILKASKVNKHL